MFLSGFLGSTFSPYSTAARGKTNIDTYIRKGLRIKEEEKINSSSIVKDSNLPANIDILGT